MAKTLFFYSDINQVAASNAFRTTLQNAGLTFTELRLGQDQRRHPVQYPGIEAVIDVDGQVYEEVQDASAVQARFAAAPTTAPAPTPDFISPIFTKAQVKNETKSLLETNPDTWTANQQKRAAYITLLLQVNQYLKTGNIP